MKLDDKKMHQIHKELYDIVNAHIGPEDPKDVFILSGVMLKVALELYTTVLQDEDIENLLQVASNDISSLRNKFEDKLGPRTIH